MLLDNDTVIKKQISESLLIPRKRPSNDYHVYIQDLPEMTHEDWIANVPFKIFSNLYIDLVRVNQDCPGTYTSAIQFSDGILNFRFTGDKNDYTTKVPTITLDIILSNYGLRDSSQVKTLADKQIRVLRAIVDHEVVNEWLLKLDKKDIIWYMYNYMKMYQKGIIYQEIQSNY